MSTGTLVAGPLPKIGRQELEQIPVPEATLTHKPVPHHVIVEALRIVAGRIEGGVSPGTIAKILGGAGHESRAGHSKRPPKEVHDGWCSSAGRRVFVYLLPTSEQKEGIRPESGHRCRCYFSFSRSLFRPGASEKVVSTDCQTPLFSRVSGLEDRE